MQILSILFIYSNPFINNIYICAKVIASTRLFFPVFIVYPDTESKTPLLAHSVTGGWLPPRGSSSAPIRAGSGEEQRAALVGPQGRERCRRGGSGTVPPSHPAVLPGTWAPGGAQCSSIPALCASSLLLTYQNPTSQ